MLCESEHALDHPVLRAVVRLSLDLVRLVVDEVGELDLVHL